jgi:chitin synthase
MTVAAFLLAYRCVESVARREGPAIQASDLFADSIFTDDILSLTATRDVYCLISDIREL